MNASDFLYEKYGIAVTEHNKLSVAIKPMDLLKYMEEYAALRQPPVSGEVCHKCRTEDFDNCHSIRCPMRKEEATIKTEWDIRKCFEQLRFDKDIHLGMGDIRLTIGMQEEICELVERFYRCR